MLEYAEMIALIAAPIYAERRTHSVDRVALENAVRDAKEIWKEVLKQEREQ